MPSVARQGQTLAAFLRGGKVLDDFPGVILRAVVDKADRAFLRDLAFVDELVHFLKEHGGRYRQDFLFVETGHDNP